MTVKKNGNFKRNKNAVQQSEMIYKANSEFWTVHNFGNHRQIRKAHKVFFLYSMLQTTNKT